MKWKILIVIIVLLVLIFGIIKTGNYLFKADVAEDIRKLTLQASKRSSKVIIKADLGNVPEPVRKYLKYAGVIGKSPVKTVRLKQEGTIRLAPDQGRMDFTATQYYSTEPGGFIWSADVKMLPGIILKGKDTYIGGQGHMLIKLFGLFTFVDSKGYEIDQGGMIRYINEHVWFPTAFLNDYFSWFSIDERSAEAVVRFGGFKTNIMFYFNESGQMINFETERYRSIGNDLYELNRWSTPLMDYREINGFRVPTRGQAVWHLQDRNFTYVDMTITDIKYDIDLSVVE